MKTEKHEMFYKGKCVLVTGGSGFVGTHIVQELLKREACVRVPIHHRPMIVPDSRIEIVQADLARQEECRRVLQGVDYVFHAAGAVAAAQVNPMSAITINMVLTSQILEAAWAEKVDRILIFGSSAGYPAADYPIKEDEMWSGPPHPSYFGYGWMRRCLERISEYVASKSGVKVAMVRPTAVYGRHDNFDPATSHVVPALIRKAVEKADPYEVWGSGEHIRDFLHISDLARGCLMMLEKHAVADPVNIGYGQATPVKDIVNIVLSAAGHEKANVVYNASKPTTIPIRMVDTSKAKKTLGFQPEISLEEGLRDTVQWYARNGRGH